MNKISVEKIISPVRGDYRAGRMPSVGAAITILFDLGANPRILRDEDSRVARLVIASQAKDWTDKIVLALRNRCWRFYEEQPKTWGDRRVITILATLP